MTLARSASGTLLAPVALIKKTFPRITSLKYKDKGILAAVAASGRSFELTEFRINGTPYVSLSELVANQDAVLEVDDTGQAAGVLSKVYDISYVRGTVTVACSLPDVKPTFGSLTNPDRVYVDIPGSKLALDQREAAGDGKLISRIRWSQFDPSTVRVVADLAATPDPARHKLKSADGKISLIPAFKPGPENPAAPISRTSKPLAARSKKATASVLAAQLVKSDSGEELDLLSSEPLALSGTLVRGSSRMARLEISNVATLAEDFTLPTDGELTSQWTLEQKPDGTVTLWTQLKGKVYFAHEESRPLGSALCLTRIIFQRAPGVGGKLSDRIVVIDPGHDRSFTGARRQDESGAWCNEEEITLDISRRLGDLLEERGIKAVFTRLDGTPPDEDYRQNLKMRARVANHIGADFFVSIHCNSTATETTTQSGTEIYYCHPQSYWLADAVALTLPGMMATRDGGVRWADFRVIKDALMPSILVETAYVSNAEDRAKLLDAEYRQRAAQAICDAIVDYVEGD
jgi:N-acetylmuramoyl-L-alanine amidase